MKKVANLFLIAIVMCAVALPAFAGEGYKCNADAQTCINKIAETANNRGWLGVELDENEHGLVITKVVSDSPAAKAYLRSGERLVALNGVQYGADEAAMKEVYKEVKPGKVVTYTIASKEGKERSVKVTLGHMPEEVVAKWLGHHMLTQHAEVAHVN